MLYGFRQAAAAWERLYSGKLEGCGFVRGKSCGVVFYHPARDVSCVVHGDDFTFVGCEEDLRWITKMMRGWFDIKVRAKLGPDAEDDKDVVILGRQVKWTESGIEYKADPKHRELILEHFGFEKDTKGLSANGEKNWRPNEEWEEELLEKEESTQYRAVCARGNFLSLDCPDLQFPIKDCSRDMSKPVVGSWKNLKKLARYLVNRESVVWNFPWQSEKDGTTDMSHVCTDSDWGGQRRDRKSTSGGVWFMGNHS